MNLTKISGSKIARHILTISCLALLLIFWILYPFIEGRYDRLALPLSNMVQLLGITGLPVALTGLLWLFYPMYRFGFGIASIVTVTISVLFLALSATFSAGISFGILLIAAWIYFLFRLIPKLKQPEIHRRDFNPVPLYLVFLPVCTLIFQIAVAKSVTERSRAKAILNAAGLIADIEKYRERHGQYPVSMQAQYADYDPGITGIEHYRYTPQEDSYNLSFEQPRFLLDDFGVREWVVYHPKDEHKVYSHSSWFLNPATSHDPPQGWFSSGETGYPHWKYFLFD